MQAGSSSNATCPESTINSQTQKPPYVPDARPRVRVRELSLFKKHQSAPFTPSKPLADMNEPSNQSDPQNISPNLVSDANSSQGSIMRSRALSNPLSFLRKRSSAPNHPVSPDIDVDYGPLDIEDPDVEITWLRSFVFFGLSADPLDPRYKALAKFKSVTLQHGIDDLRWPDYLLGISIYLAMVNRAARQAMRPSSSLFSLLSVTSSSPSSTPSTSRSLFPSQALPSLGRPLTHQHRRRYRCASVYTPPPQSPRRWSPCSTPPDSPSRRSSDISIGSIKTTLNKKQESSIIFEEHSIPKDDQDLKECPKIPESSGTFQKQMSCRLHYRQSSSSSCRQRSCSIGFDNDHFSPHKHSRSLEDVPTLPNRRWSLPSENFSRTQSATSSVPTHTASMEPDYIQLSYHMLRHAESIYGLPITVASAPRISLTRLTDHAIVCRRTGVKANDLLLAQFSAKPFLPAFYVAVDRRVRAVIVCIRGTANLPDSLTDLAASQDPLQVRCQPDEVGSPLMSPSTSTCTSISAFRSPSFVEALVTDKTQSHVEGLGHAGVIRSARNLLALVRRDIVEAIRANPGYVVVTTGHSLGAATAAVLALLMREDNECPHAFSVAFAPPPCLTYELAEQTAALGVTLINGPDIVPRLSVALLLPIFATARYVADLPRAKRSLLSVGVRNGVIDWDDLEQQTAKRAAEMEKLHDGKRLFIPGRVFQLVRRDEASQKQNTCNIAFRSRDMDVLRVSRAKYLHVRARERRMFLAHAPFSYRSSLSLALRHHGQKPISVTDIGQVMARLARGRSFQKVWSDYCECRVENTVEIPKKVMSFDDEES